MNGEVRSVESLPQARCTPEFCALDIERGGWAWHWLMGRGTDWVPKDELAAACAASDIVVADRWLPRSCRPRFLKADKSLLYRTGGLVIDLESKAVTTVASGQGAHGWWQEPAAARPRKVSPRGSNSSSPLPQ